MSNALLSRSYELQKLASAMGTMVDVTTDSLNSALAAHMMVMAEVTELNDFLQKLRRRVSKGVSGRGRDRKKQTSKGREAHCPKQISAIGMGAFREMQWPTGYYMEADHRSVFVLAGEGHSSELREYHSTLELEYNLVDKFFRLPFLCSRIGHVIFKRHFYCHKAGTNMVVKYHLKRKEIVSELALPGAWFGLSPPSGAGSGIDLAQDELGLWAVYVTNALTGNLVITKIDHRKMEIARTWQTTYSKHKVGKAFMICGVLYATEGTPTSIRYMFNTETNREQMLEEGALPFASSANQKTLQGQTTNPMILSYDMRNSALYSWSNGWLGAYPVYFSDSGTLNQFLSPPDSNLQNI